MQPPPTKCTTSSLSPARTGVCCQRARGTISRLCSTATRSAGSFSQSIKAASVKPSGTCRDSPFSSMVINCPRREPRPARRPSPQRRHCDAIRVAASRASHFINPFSSVLASARSHQESEPRSCAQLEGKSRRPIVNAGTWRFENRRHAANQDTTPATKNLTHLFPASHTVI